MITLTATTTVNLDSFARSAADTAMRGAVEYLATQGQIDAFRKDDAAVERLVATIRRHVRETLNQALDDAKAAVEANMASIATATFAASMRLAGISAAKEVLA